MAQEVKDGLMIREVGEITRDGETFYGVILEGSVDAVRGIGHLFGAPVALSALAPSPSMREAVEALTEIAGLIAGSSSSDTHTRLHRALDKMDEARAIARAALRSLTGAKP